MPCPDDNDDLLAGDYFEVNISDPGKVQPDDFIIVPYLGGSDYSGDSVNVSNYRAFKKRFGDCRGVHEIVGGHGTYGIAVRADCFTPEMSEYLERLAVYPIPHDIQNSRKIWLQSIIYCVKFLTLLCVIA